MKRIVLTIAVGAVAAIVAMQAHAADLAVDPPMAVMPEAASLGLYAKVYGGYVFENNLFYRDTDYDTDAGWLAGASIGVDPGLGGLWFELDATTGSVLYSFTEASLAGTTLMGNAVFTADLDAFEVYGGAGVGGVYVDYATNDGIPDFNGNGVAAAYQIFAGAGFNVTDNVSVFAEGRYQSAFDNVPIVNNIDETVDVEWNRAAVLIGLKVSN